MTTSKVYSISIRRESILSVQIGIFNIWILSPDIKNKDRYYPMSVGNNFVVRNYRLNYIQLPLEGVKMVKTNKQRTNKKHTPVTLCGLATWKAALMEN